MPQAAKSHPDIGAVVKDAAKLGSQGRASTFPKQRGGHLPHSAQSAPLPSGIKTLPYDSGLVSGDQSVSNMSSGPYTPTSGGFGHPFGSLDTSPLNPAMQQYGFQSTSNPNLPDLSAMMFPSAEPFTYPNQPLTTFENNQYVKEPQFYNNLTGYDDPSTMLPQRTSGTTDDNLEAQLFTLPPYLSQQSQWNMAMQNQSQQAQRQHSSGLDQRGMAMPTSAPNWNQYPMPQGQAFSDINLNDVFGSGEWNNMLMDQ